MTDRHRLHIPVDGAGHIVAWLTVPDTLQSPFLQILLHGGTYTHHYWDFPYQPERYSYVQWAASRGYATLNLDRLGAGASSRPPGLSLDLPLQAAAIDRIARQAVDGFETPAGPVRFSGAVLIGHSVGSILAGLTAAEYGSAKAVVLTGTTALNSGVTSGDPRTGPQNFMAAHSDPALADRHDSLDESYVTLRADAREVMWFYLPNTDPEVVAIDERLKDTLTFGEIMSLGPAAEAATRIRCPALVVLGQQDIMMFDPSRDSDGHDAMKRAATGAPNNFLFEVVPDAGHNLNLHRNATLTYESIARFLATLQP